MLLPENAFLLGLSSIHWREAWKYGERAFRYCQLDAGHAIAAVRYAAASLGWQACVLTHAGDKEIKAILGIDREADFDGAECEHPDVILLITTNVPTADNDTLSLTKIAEIAKNSQWYGQANTLSQQHLHDWPVIAEAALACTKPESHEQAWQAPSCPTPIINSNQQAASTIIKQRRSAQQFDTNGSISKYILYRMLDLTLPRQAVPPWDAISWEPRNHLLLFIHRVENLEPGLYIFLRNDHIKNKFQRSLKQAFEWTKPPGCPQHLQLFRLAAGDVRNVAKTLSCHQDIAGDGALSLGILAEYETNLTREPWVYRQLFWEAGMLGHILYLEAESAGFRGTGIGCFFDDEVHDLVGVKGHEFQSLYHFTIGTALHDNRLQTLPAYAHLQRVNLG
jgi:nitroreductase